MTDLISDLSDLIGNAALLLFGISFLILAKPLRNLLLGWSADRSAKPVGVLLRAARHIVALVHPIPPMIEAPPPGDESEPS